MTNSSSPVASPTSSSRDSSVTPLSDALATLPLALPPVPVRIAQELGLAPHQVSAAITLLDGGATVPFIARYRKEATDSLDDAQLRDLEERLRYLRELDARRDTILESIREQGKLDAELEARIMAADTKSRLEDIYLPFKPRRRTRAQIAREAGLEPLAIALLGDPTLDPETEAAAYVDSAKEVPDVVAALDGARAILVETFSEDADLVGRLRERVWSEGRLVAQVKEGKEAAGEKFADYFEYSENLDKLPSHRVLAMFRGEKEDILTVSVEAGGEIEPDDDETASARPSSRRVRTHYEAAIASHFNISNQGRPGDTWLADCVRRAWRGRIGMGLEVDLRLRLRENAERDAIAVFAANLRDLLLAAPAGERATLGLDPGFRTGVKVAVVDATGKVVDTAVIYPHVPANKWDASLATLRALVVKHGVQLISIGNGTASRETDKLAADLIKLLPEAKLTKVVVSEAGASVYSASAYASREFPDMDVTLRGAVSIARRLQDPLAELVKIDPKSIGVGQYQHDLAESQLGLALDTVVEDCVNSVGVDLNTASIPLLTRVSGVGPTLAESIVAHREANGAFPSRAALREVPRLGPKAFEQCAGFLRVRGGEEPLDASSVHPEAYPLARTMAQAAGSDLAHIIGNAGAVKALAPKDFVTEAFGLPTVTDVMAELVKPGRDPRPTFKTATFADGVEKLGDLKPGMKLEGVVTNVAAFGAFVDIGVHQDGLVHISALSDRFVSDPREVVKPGDVVRAMVLSVDVERKRIALTLRMTDEIPAPGDGAGRGGRGSGGQDGRAGGGRGAGGGQGSARGSGGHGSGQGGRDGRGGARGGRSGGAAPDSAMADALRRAGLALPGEQS